ncbi:chaperone modulator CbpM [Zhongshania aquimaris]|uniref:Chaperone modulatory protein CbpM n=1 Tax=Zhongshania aquimaris TaxID=2857107 RepID=A0ABS6VT68_9GAMM|nr:chaperone modulator CbpM [Zhongshania aquimaris]MBW2941514.1 chaperone modulatory protein CbpM [Zhongshania aquimaris]
MNNTQLHIMKFDELCRVAGLPEHFVLEIVEQGIVEPDGDSPDQWIFTTQMVSITKKAVRLHQDLDIDWPGIALAISLLDDLEQLRAENHQLKQRLNRFTAC